MPSDFFAVHNDKFLAILGEEPTLELLAENEYYAFAHEAGVFIPERNELFITSNRIQNPSGEQRVQITKVQLSNASPSGSVTCEELSVPIPMANGGINYKDGIIICAQGSIDEPSGLYYMSSKPPYKSTLLKGDFHGRALILSMMLSSTATGYRPKPRLPNQVYRYNPADDSIRAVADGFGRPNGICFSPDGKTVYITDTDWIHGDGTTDDTRPSSIYAFDVVLYHKQPFLTNRRLFAMADSTIPDGIKCDLEGNVYSGCGDGLNVWSPGGDLLGRILVKGGVANFCFGRDGEIFLLNEHRLWRTKLNGNVKGALLGI